MPTVRSLKNPAQYPPEYAAHDKPHPFVGRIAVGAIIFTMLAIVWAKVEILGTRDIERTLNEEDATLGQLCADRLAAVAFNRWATGFSQ